MTESNEPKEQAPKEQAHLGYLLTAYLFESLSAAGVKEVEAHLAQCARCREELATLRRTLNLVEKNFDTGGKTYFFEERRRQRVLEAARRRQPPASQMSVWGRRGLISVAALLMCGVLLFAMGTKRGEIQDQLRHKGGPPRNDDYSVANAETAAPVPSKGMETESRTQTYKDTGRTPAGRPVPMPTPARPLESKPRMDFRTPPPPPAAKPAAPADLESGMSKNVEARRRPGYSFGGTSSGGGSGSSSGGGGGPGGGTSNGGGGDGGGGGDMDGDVTEIEPRNTPSTPAQKDGLVDTWHKAGDTGTPDAKPKPADEEEKDVSGFRIRRTEPKFTLDLHENQTAEVNIDPAREATKFPTTPPPALPANGRMVAGRVVIHPNGNSADLSKNTKTRDSGEQQQQAQEMARKDALNSGPASKDSSDIDILPDIIAKAELGDHFETINPDKPDTHSALGNPEAHRFRSENFEASPEGGGGTGGMSMDDVIGVGGQAVKGSGGGFGGGDGTGVGAGNDNFGNRNGKKDKKLTAKQQQANASPRSPDDQPAQLGDNAERLLRGYRYFHAQNPDLSFRDYARRPSPVPAAVLTDDGLDEDDYIERFGTRPFVDCERDHLSTFGLDVDTASYTLARSRLRQGQLPAPDAVRVEEFLNYFKQPYTVGGDDAFGVFAEGAPSPFACAGVEILKIGIKSREPRADERKPAMLTFCIDTSGSMTRDDRLELVRKALAELVKQLNPEDAVSIVGFNAQAELILPRTQARQKQRILDAIDTLRPSGATNVEAGLNMAYRMADESYSPDAVNRVILCSDGVANVGAKGPDEILKLVKLFAERGIELSTVGFAMGQYNDKMMVRLADNGNGSCHFVDTLAEAQKIFTEQLPPHLNVLARDAKAQVDFDPAVVARYRLLGYEKRKIADKDFRNDAIDSGDVAHSTLITVIYELLRKPAAHGALGKIYLRWKDAGYRHLPVVERNYPLGEGVMAGDIQEASPDFRFMACVAHFAELLRESPWVRDSSYAAVLEELNTLPPALQGRADCREVVELVRLAQRLSIEKWLKEIRR